MAKLSQKVVRDSLRAAGRLPRKAGGRSAQKVSIVKLRAAVPLKFKSVSKKTVYVAVVVRKGDDLGYGPSLSSNRDDARWSAALGHDKAAVIEEGMALVAKYGSERYELVVGKMTERVQMPKPKFEVVKL